MNESYFSPLLEAAEFLGDTENRNTLQQMQSVYQNKLYFVAFIGQFSAGKSHLLNNLLKRDLLPTSVVETTPLLTYLRYGEQEGAKLHYMDGNVQDLDLAQVARLIQHKKEGEDNPWDLDRLEFLEVYLDEEMLRSGMILLDTPGVNTLIEKHEQLLSTSLSLASGIVYVTKGAPSKVDEEKLSMLTGAGFDVFFVRTHCDEIKKAEGDTPERAMEDDWKCLEKCGVRRERCYYVSNLEDSPLFAALDSLREMLREKGGRAAEELESSMESQLLVLAKRFEERLENHRRILEPVHARNQSEMEKHEQEILAKIKQLQRKIDGTEETIRKSIEGFTKALQKDAKPEIEKALSASKQRIETNTEVANEAAMNALIRNEASKISHIAYLHINAVLDPMVQKIDDDVPLDNIDLKAIPLPQVDNYQELRVAQDDRLTRLRERLSAIRENRSELEKVLSERAESPEYLALQQELEQLQNELQAVQAEQSNRPAYVPKMIEVDDGKAQPSEIARQIGGVVDWALLLLPGAQIEEMFTALATGPKAIAQYEKLVALLEKAGWIAKKGDTVKDVLFALKNLKNLDVNKARRQRKAIKIADGMADKGKDVIGHLQQEDTSILSLLTVQHWAGKLGEMFDRPPRLVEDEEYKAQYLAEKQQLEREQLSLQKNIYEKSLKAGVFKNDEERLRAEKESLRVDQEAIEKELAKMEIQLRGKAREEALKKWRGDCADWYEEEVKQQLRKVITSYTESFPARLAEYYRQRLQAIYDALEQEQKDYTKLRSMPEDEIARELQRVDELLGGVRSVLGQGQ